MKRGICPKCNEKEIFYRQNSAHSAENIPITDFSSAVLTYYVCLNCGYLELYLEREKNL